MTLGQRVQMLRKRAGLTQSELAKLIGYNCKASISKIENDILDINQSTVVALAKALNTTPSVIMGWEEIPGTKRSEPPEGDPLDTRILELLLKLTDEERREVLGLIYERLHARGAI